MPLLIAQWIRTSPLPCQDEQGQKKRNHQKHWIINHGDTDHHLSPLPPNWFIFINLIRDAAAISLLKDGRWDVQVAVNNFYSGGANTASTAPQPKQAPVNKESIEKIFDDFKGKLNQYNQDLSTTNQKRGTDKFFGGTVLREREWPMLFVIFNCQCTGPRQHNMRAVSNRRQKT